MLDSWDITCWYVAFICPAPSAAIELQHVTVFFSSSLSFPCCFFCCSSQTQNLFSFSRKKYHGILFCIGISVLLCKSLFLRVCFFFSMSAFLFNLSPALFLLPPFFPFSFHLRDHVRTEQIIVVWPLLLLLWQESSGEEPWNIPQKGCS